MEVKMMKVFGFAVMVAIHGLILSVYTSLSQRKKIPDKYFCNSCLQD